MKNKATDAYIAKAPDFAKPIIRKLRSLFHQACPAIEEKIKWGHLSFEHKGIVGGMGTFKHHAAFGFWRQDALPDPDGLFKGRGPFASKVSDVAQLPSDAVILRYIKAAVKLNESGPPARKIKPKPPLKVPGDLVAALKKNAKARATFDGFPPSHKREYVEWITEAKREETRAARLATTLEWLSKGKSRNWKYEKC